MPRNVEFIAMDGEREREIKSSDSNLSVSAFEHISLCKFRPLRRLPCLLSNKIPKILWILLEYSYPPFIYPSIQDNNSETEEKKGRRDKDVSSHHCYRSNNPIVIDTGGEGSGVQIDRGLRHRHSFLFTSFHLPPRG